jgi:uncharacterized membrane protein YccC
MLVALFPQDRVGFYVLLSLWLGACAYWATLRQGYVSYAASLGAFTSAIVSAGVTAAPLHVWQTAIDRGSATVLGILFALLASNTTARSDDVPGDLPERVRTLASDLLGWAIKQFEPGRYNEPKDAPFTAQILSLDEACTNAIAERPALNYVKSWFQGLPTALLSLQSAVLSMCNVADDGTTSKATSSSDKHLLQNLVSFLQSSDALDVDDLRQQSSALARLQRHSPGQTSSQKECIRALRYLMGGLEAILTLAPPETPPEHYPRPTFAAHPRHAAINLIRTIVGMAAGFLIWNFTAWAQGPVFMVNIAVAMVIFVSLDDPVSANWANIIGTTLGGVLGLALKYLLLVRDNNPLTLVLALFPILFISAWIETKGKLAPLGLFLIIGVLLLIEPRNPQEYDFVHDINLLIAVELGYGLVTLVFLMIGDPRKGVERVAELLLRMRRHRQSAVARAALQQRLSWAKMYDELQRLQAATNDPKHRDRAVKLLLTAWGEAEPTTCRPAPSAMN